MADPWGIRQPYDTLDDSSEDNVKVTYKGHNIAKTWNVPRKRLCEGSEWFKRRLKNASVEDVAITSQISGFRSPITLFRIFAWWINFSTIITQRVLDYDDPPAPYVEDKEYLVLTDLWRLGQAFESPGFQSAVVTTMLARLEESKAAGQVIFPGPESIKRSYHESDDMNTKRVGPNKLQEVLVEIYAKQDSKGQLDKTFARLTPVFMKDLWFRQAALLQPILEHLPANKVCEFHEHAPDEVCNVLSPAAKRRRELDVNETHTASEPAAKRQMQTLSVENGPSVARPHAGVSRSRGTE